MRSKSFRIVLNIAVIISMLLPNVTAFAAHAHPPERASAAQPRPAPDSGLFRTRVQVDAPARWQRLESLGVVILQRDEDSALVLVDDQQLEALARLRFQPRGSDELGALAAAQGKERAWLRAVLQPLLRQGAALQAQARAAKAGAGVDADALTAARADLRSAMHALTPEQRAGIASSISPDDDGDGLTNTEESWWCTDPQMADTDSDGISDGEEIGMLKDWMANRRAGPPGGTPWPSWPFNSTTCPDKDHDSIPNLAERWELGMNMDWESTDHDKFDDGQELFGVTYCPGGDNNCGYGDLPRSSDAGYVGANMPAWVKAPGNHPLVAAFPVPEIDVVESSFHVETATVVTTDHTITKGTEKTYSTTKTKGTSTATTNTRTWNNWQEMTETRPEATSKGQNLHSKSSAGALLGAAALDLVTSGVKGLANCGYQELQGENSGCGKIYDRRKQIKAAYKGAVNEVYGDKWWKKLGHFALCNSNPLSQFSCSMKLTRAFWRRNHEMVLEQMKKDANSYPDHGGSGHNIKIHVGNSGVSISPVFQVSYPLLAPYSPITQSHTDGKSWGGEQSTRHTKYEEHAVTNGEAFSDSNSWSNATAQDSTHSADLWFTYKVRNTGDEYAREIGDLTFNVYIGDDPNPAITYFVANDVGGDGKFHNFMPDEEHTYTSAHIPLSLERMKAIDLGGPLRIVVEDFNYGVDELFYQDAVNAGVFIAIEDGKDDGDEAIDTFLIPTWGEETVMDVLARYFPHDVDEDGNLIAIWTPEYNRTDTPAWCVEPQAVGIGANRILWCKHALSTADWWNIYTDGMGDGSEGFQDTPASGGAVALFRFNKDSDLDGYSDRSEAKLGTAPNDPDDYPRPELIAGVHSIQAGNHVTATLSLLNTGLYDSYGVEAVMIAPNDTISITNNIVGGSGRVRAQKQVVVGSGILLQNPLPDAWTQDGHAQPAVGGYYNDQQDRTYTFTVACGDGVGCEVGTGTWTLDWDDGDGHSGSLDFGDGYASPTLLDVGAFGLKLGLLSGHVDNGDSFTVETNAPRETFQYEIASGYESDYTPPLVIVSYNDPQGNHRFLLPADAMNLIQPTDNLAPLGGTMLPDVGAEIVTSQAAQAGANSTDLVVTNPGDVTLSDAHLFLEFVNITGTVVSEVPVTVTVEPGPNVVSIDWDTADFDPAYQPDEDYIVMAFWTDYQGNILSTSGRPLSTFQDDPRSHGVIPQDTWDFGAIKKGDVVSKDIAIVSTGASDLRLGLGAHPAEISVAIPERSADPGMFRTIKLVLDSSTLPDGPYTASVEVRTNDVDEPIKTITVTGQINASSAMATQIDPMRPWDESIYIPGQRNENEIIEVASAVEQTNELRPLYLFDEGGSPIGFGNDALGLNGVGQAPPSASEACTLGVKSFHQTAENSSSLSPLPEESKIDVSAQPELTTSTQVIVETPSLTPSYYNDMCGSAWHRLTNNRGHYFYLTLNTNNPADSMNSGKWKPNLPQSGRYNVDAYIATHPEFDWQCPSRHISGDTHDARYKIHHKDGTTTVSRDQFPLNNQWLDLGTYRFNAGTSGDVILSDLNGEANLTRSVSFSAMRFTLQPPDKPTLNDISNPSNANSYSVNWQSGFGASGYQWQERYNGGSWGSAQSTSSTSITRSDRTPGVWCYRVRSTNSAGSSAWTAEKCTSVKPYTAPVLDPISNSDSDGSYAVNWSAVSGATSYTLQEKHDSGAWSTIYTGASTSQNLTGRTSGVWSYQVRANNSAGSGPWSNTVSTTVNTAPNKPINLNPADDTGVLGRALNLNWQDGGDPDNAPNAYREFQVKIQNDGWSHTSDWSQDTNWQGVVPQDSVYSWQVEAFDGLETSGWTDAQTLRVYSIAKTSPDNIAVALPNSVTDYVRYQVQYGVITNLPSASTPEIVHITVPKRVYSEAYLDMIISEPLTGEITYDIDVGNNGANIWHGSVTGNGGTPALVESPNLAEAFNAYLAAQPEGGGEPVTIPISISLDTAGVVYLTHAVLTPGVDSDPSVQAGDISFGQPNPTETDVVHISAQVHNDGSYRAENVVATFYAVDAENRSFQIGTDFLSSIDASAVGQVGVDWNTTGFTGPTDIKVVLDAANQLDELDETNNVITTTLTILTRPDLAIPAIGLSDEEPMAGETVTVTLPISNSGQTAAASAVTALSVQAPDGSTSTLCEPSLAVGAGAQASAACAWTPAAPGRYRLLVQADRDNGVDESNEGNNQRWRDVYVGLASPILLDSGGDSDAAYDPTTGYGYLNGQANTFCGAEPEHSQRTNASGPVKYRFDHLLPGHFYHLDVTLYECDGVGRQEKIWVDDNPVSDMVDLADHNVHALSFLLDPAFYADRSIEVSIEELLGNDVVVAGVNLYDVDYRYADAGGGDDLPYDAMRGYGWVDGIAQTNWGTLPYRSRRIDLGDSDPSDDPDNQLVYRFDALDPGKRYQVHFVFYQASGSAVHQEIAIDGYNTGATVDLNGEQRVDLTVDVPPGAYSADGTIQVYINRTDASTSAFVNEIALEELTIGPNETNMITQVKSLHPTSPNWVSFFVKPPVQGPNECSGVTQTSSFTSVAGEALLAGANAPLDSVVEAYSASGDKVGCFQVSTPGLYGYMRIYGNPGMSDGEPVFFKINGIPAQSDPPYFIWHDDKGVHTLNLDAPDLIPVETMAQSIWDHFSRLQCQNGTYLPPPADQRYNTCHTVTPGRGYLLYTDAAADWSLAGVPLDEDAPLPLEAGWNWLGYLPQCELGVETALASISGQYDLIHSEAGTYLPPPADPAFNNFNTLAPTLGYMIHTTAAVTLTYPVGQCGQLLHDQVEPVATEDCQAVATGQFSSYYGYAMKGEEPFPPGASIRVLSPRGEVVGCGQVQQDGLFPYLRVYGQDGDLPGMVYGETPAFFIDGRPVLPEPAVVWMPDMSVHQVQLNPPPGQLYLPMLTVP